MVRAVLDSDIKPLGTRMVATALAYHANEQSGEAWPSHGTLAAECGLHRDSVRHALKQLVGDGVLQVVIKSNGGGHRSTTRYRFDSEWAASTGGRQTPGSRQPGVEHTPDRGSTGPQPGVDGPPKRDERKPTVSLSSKPPAPSPAGQPAAGRPSRMPGLRASAVAAPPQQPNSQQPLARGKGTVGRDLPAWLSSREGIEAKGVEVGVGPFNESTEPPGKATPYARYVLRVMVAAGHVKPRSKPGAGVGR